MSLDDNEGDGESKALRPSTPPLVLSLERHRVRSIPSIEANIASAQRITDQLQSISRDLKDNEQKRGDFFVDRSIGDISDFRRFFNFILQHKLPSASNILRGRMVELSVRRRSRFLYWKAHSNQLESLTPLGQGGEVVSETMSTGNHHSVPTPIPDDFERRSQTLVSSLNRVNERIASLAPLTVRSNQFTGNLPSYPPIPKRNAMSKELKCPYCFTVLPNSINSARWRFVLRSFR